MGGAAPRPKVDAIPLDQVDLSFEIGGKRWANPIGTASGTYGKGLEFQPFYDVAQLGFVVVKTITSEPRAGNPPPRLAETAGGLLNSIGLPNPGVEAYIETYLPKLRTLGSPLVINIAGHDVEDFPALAKRFAQEEGIDAFELNMSCPNVSGGLDYSTDPAVAEDVVRRVRDVTDIPLLAKLSPNVTDVRPIAEAAARGGAAGISAINTLVGMAVDWRAQKPVLGRGFGGLSGPCIKPVGLRIVKQISSVVDIPVIGIGGIQNADDVMEYLVAGARAVQIGTANYYRPNAAIEILQGVRERMAEMGWACLNDVVGSIRMPS